MIPKDLHINPSLLLFLLIFPFEWKTHTFLLRLLFLLPHFYFYIAFLFLYLLLIVPFFGTEYLLTFYWQSLLITHLLILIFFLFRMMRNLYFLVTNFIQWFRTFQYRFFRLGLTQFIELRLDMSKVFVWILARHLKYLWVTKSYM